MLMAQTSTPASPPPQDAKANASAQDQNATKPTDRSATKPSDTTAGADQNAAATTDNNSKAKSDANPPTRAESPDAASPNPTNAARDGAQVPWLWIVLGAVALIALLSLLGGRGPERSDRVTMIDRTRQYERRRVDDRDDDIRKAS
jgi:hypothetical protein